MPKLINRRAVSIILIIWAFLLTSPILGQQRQKSASHRIALTQWSEIRGVNYIPSYGRNLYEIWRDYNHQTFEGELRLAKKVGYKSVRLWLNYFAFAERGKKMVDDVKDAVKLCQKHGLKVLIVLFDACGIRPRPNTRLMTVKEAYDSFLASPRLPTQQKELVKSFYQPFANGPGRDILIPVAPVVEDTRRISCYGITGSRVPDTTRWAGSGGSSWIPTSALSWGASPAMTRFSPGILSMSRSSPLKTPFFVG